MDDDITHFTDLISARIDAVTDAYRQDNALAPEAESDAIPVLQRFSEIPAAPLTWVWPGWIPAGTLTILGGHVGDGKSTVSAAIVAALTNGNPLPDGTTAPLANVLILSAEDDPARVIRPRLDANDADLDRVFMLDGAHGTAGPDTHRGWFDLRRDADHLREIIEEHDISLIVIDSLGSFLRGSDRASEGAVRDALQPLMRVIADTGVAALGIMRVGKTVTGRRPAQRLVGSSAVPAIARSVIMLANAPGDEDTPDRAILQVVKSNYVQAPAPVAIHIAATSTVQWLGPASTGIDESATRPIDASDSKTEREEAADFLREYLKDDGTAAYDVLAQAKRLGFSEITIRRAKKDAGVCSFRTTHGTWAWRLPTKRDLAAQARRTSDTQ